MTKAEAWGLLIQALGWFGGGAALTIAIAGFVSKFVADRSIERHKALLGQETERLKGELAKETETHKLKLKKQELLFNEQLKAAQAFADVRNSIEPSYRPGMDFAEAAEAMAEDLPKIENSLVDYLAKYGHVWPASIRTKIQTCSWEAAENKLFVIDGPDETPPSGAIEAAEQVLASLPEIQEMMLAIVVE